LWWLRQFKSGEQGYLFSYAKWVTGKKGSWGMSSPFYPRIPIRSPKFWLRIVFSQFYLSKTKEGQLAARDHISFRAAIGRRFDLKEAVATAKPFSVAHLAHTSSYLYDDGVLCYVFDGEIRCLDVHRSEDTEKVLNVLHILRRCIPRLRTEEDLDCVHVSLLCYRVGILAVSVEIAHGHGAWLMALDLSSTRPKSGRLRFIEELETNRRLFVRHNGKYLYYGVQVPLASRELPQWVIRRYDLEMSTHSLCEDAINLDGLAGQDIGQNICFEIFGDHLYAVSTQTHLDDVDQDWTSYYLWYCISPRGGRSNISTQRMRRSWRRQHHEGPINDSWTILALYEHESTGQPIIYECRREWLNGASDNVRTYYTHPLPIPSEIGDCKDLEVDEDEDEDYDNYYDDDDEEEDDRDGDGPPRRRVAIDPCLISRPTISAASTQYSDILPSNILLPAIRSTSSPKEDGSYSTAVPPPRKRLRRYVHAEYNDDDGQRHRKDFILARTKYRTYNASASAFVDLVNDPSVEYSRVGQPDRLRLRINPRKRKRQDMASSLSLSSSLTSLSRPDSDDNADHFILPGVEMWPAENEPQELFDLLCPTRRLRGMEATGDERSIVYAVNSGNGEERTIILLSFDPQIRFKSMRQQTQKSDIVRNENRQTTCRSGTPSMPTSLPQLQEQQQQQPPPPNMPPAFSSFRLEPALHLSIDRGIWLRWIVMAIFSSRAIFQLAYYITIIISVILNR
jgi:hypothetical protein